jgi:hypothetical protein
MALFRQASFHIIRQYLSLTSSRSLIYPSSIINNRFIGCLLVSSKPVGQQPGRQLQRFHPLASYACRNVPLLKYAQGVDAQGYSNAIYSVSVYVTTVITSNVYEFINSREKDTQFNAQDYSNANIQRHCKCYHCDYFKYL